MQLQTHEILKEVEEIKTRVISLEMSLIDEEMPSKHDIEAVKSAIKEHKEHETILFNSTKF